MSPQTLAQDHHVPWEGVVVEIGEYGMAAMPGGLVGDGVGHGASSKWTNMVIAKCFVFFSFSSRNSISSLFNIFVFLCSFPSYSHLVLFCVPCQFSFLLLILTGIRPWRKENSLLIHCSVEHGKSKLKYPWTYTNCCQWSLRGSKPCSACLIIWKYGNISTQGFWDECKAMKRPILY